MERCESCGQVLPREGDGRQITDQELNVLSAWWLLHSTRAVARFFGRDSVDLGLAFDRLMDEARAASQERPLLRGWTFRDPSGAGFCPRCHLPIEVHPLDEQGEDVDRCPDQPIRVPANDGKGSPDLALGVAQERPQRMTEPPYCLIDERGGCIDPKFCEHKPQERPRPDTDGALRAALVRLIAAQDVNASVGERMAATTAARAALAGEEQWNNESLESGATVTGSSATSAPSATRSGDEPTDCPRCHHESRWHRSGGCVATYRTVDGETPCRCREPRPDTDGALDVDTLGRAFHEVASHGGPLTPCGYIPYPGRDYIKVGYNEDPDGSFACPCRSIASAILARLSAQPRDPESPE
jgi:hypothetical protein